MTSWQSSFSTSFIQTQVKGKSLLAPGQRSFRKERTLPKRRERVPSSSRVFFSSFHLPRLNQKGSACFLACSRGASALVGELELLVRALQLASHCVLRAKSPRTYALWRSWLLQSSSECEIQQATAPNFLWIPNKPASRMVANSLLLLLSQGRIVRGSSGWDGRGVSNCLFFLLFPSQIYLCSH